MEFSLASGLAVLERTPGTLREWLSGLRDEWTRADEGPETFCPFDVVGHLIHGELTDWLPRVKRILEHGEQLPFEPFDRFVMYAASEGKSMDDLLAQFTELRGGNLAELRSLKLAPEQLELTGTHPRLGRVTLAQLLSAWVVHDLGHLYQIARVMARQYQGAVGPWAFMRVLGGSES